MNAQGETVDLRKQVPPEGRASARRGSRRERKHPVHMPPSERHHRSVIIFVTVCTAGRRKILASATAHETIVGAWALASTWLVGRYVILPDHIHFFCAPNGLEAPSLEAWIKFWKSLVARKLGRAGGAVWQRHHWDRQLRRGESYDEKWEYVRSNPLRHALVLEADKWPYQGELNELRW